MCCSLRISTSIYPLPSICAEDQVQDWFDSLADCLHWNVRRQQKPLDYSDSSDSIYNAYANGTSSAGGAAAGTSDTNGAASSPSKS